MARNCYYILEINGKAELGENFAQRRDGKIHQKDRRFGAQNTAYHHINSKSNLKVSLYVQKPHWKKSYFEEPNFTYFHTPFISNLYF